VAQCDLHTIATGPANLELLVQFKDAAAAAANTRKVAHVCARVEFEQYALITAYMKQFELSPLPLVNGSAPDTFLRVSYVQGAEAEAAEAADVSYNNNFNDEKKQAKKKKKKKSKDKVPKAVTSAVVKKSSVPKFPELATRRWSATLRATLQSALCVEVCAKIGKKQSCVLGTALLPFRKYHAFRDMQSVNVSESVQMRDEFRGIVPGGVELRGALCFSELSVLKVGHGLCGQ
jgi:hypothetical protein